MVHVCTVKLCINSKSMTKIRHQKGFLGTYFIKEIVFIRETPTVALNNSNLLFTEQNSNCNNLKVGTLNYREFTSRNDLNHACGSFLKK